MIGGITLLAAGAVFARLRSEETAVEPGRRAAGAAVLSVETVSLTPRTLQERMSTTGTILANEEVEIVSEITGKIAEILFREGGHAAADDVLVKIDDTQLRAERDRAAFQVDLAERNEERNGRLLGEGLVSQEEYDFALSELNVLRSDLSLTAARLLKTSIRAPFGGVVGLREVSLGSYVTPQTRITTLQDVDPVKLDFSVPEKYAGHLEVGASVEFRTRGSTTPHSGTIIAIDPRVDRETRSLTIRAASPNRDGALVPGAFADVEIVVRRVEGALAIPSRAIIPELGGKKVFVAVDGTAQPRTVTTGLRTGEEVEVTSGLAPGDRVIVSAIPRLRPGLQIREEAARP